MENEKAEKLYRLSEVARMIGIAHSTLREWARAGKINTLKTLGGQYRVEESELQHIRELMTRHLKKKDKAEGKGETYEAERENRAPETET